MDLLILGATPRSCWTYDGSDAWNRADLASVSRNLQISIPDRAQLPPLMMFKTEQRPE